MWKNFPVPVVAFSIRGSDSYVRPGGRQRQVKVKSITEQQEDVSVPAENLVSLLFLLSSQPSIDPNLLHVVSLGHGAARVKASIVSLPAVLLAYATIYQADQSI